MFTKAGWLQLFARDEVAGEVLKLTLRSNPQPGGLLEQLELMNTLEDELEFKVGPRFLHFRIPRSSRDASETKVRVCGIADCSFLGPRNTDHSVIFGKFVRKPRSIRVRGDVGGIIKPNQTHVVVAAQSKICFTVKESHTIHCGTAIQAENVLDQRLQIEKSRRNRGGESG